MIKLLAFTLEVISLIFCDFCPIIESNFTFSLDKNIICKIYNQIMLILFSIDKNVQKLYFFLSNKHGLRNYHHSTKNKNMTVYFMKSI